EQEASAGGARVGGRPGVVCTRGLRVRRRACVRAGRPAHRVRGVSPAAL
ncbi:MAG: hypothetical protein AVDCRST_MAG93-4735, partial [uncultured Chloroflexia bacterium]